jgi:hypothetical protein
MDFRIWQRRVRASALLSGESGRGCCRIINHRPGSYVPAFRRRDNREGGGLATDRALRELLTEGLVAKAREVPSVWGALALLKARPAILVFAREATFQLWSDVLELGGSDVNCRTLFRPRFARCRAA